MKPIRKRSGRSGARNGVEAGRRPFTSGTLAWGIPVAQGGSREGQATLGVGREARVKAQDCGIANLYSLIASCKLHGIDPERYLAELIRVMPCWPRTRYLEIAPAYWAQPRARLDPLELEAELGFVTVPPFFVDTAEQSSPS